MRTNRRSLRSWSVVAIAVALGAAACTGPNTEYLAPTDGGPDAVPDTQPDGGGFFLVVPETQVAVMEGQVASFTISLSAAPTTQIDVTIAPADIERISAPSQISFDEDTWSTPQSVSVTALADDDAAPNDIGIRLSAPGASDDVEVTVQVTDDDELRVVADVSGLEVTEGGQGTIKVKLSAQPVADLTVDVALDPLLPLIASVSPTTLMFTAATWDDEQDVVITAEQDLDIAGAVSTLRLTSGSATAAAVAVTIFDDDQVGISPSPPALGSIDEGGAAVPLGISLTRAPNGPIRVTIVPELTGKVTMTPNFVDFDANTWMMVRTVQVSGAEDDDTQDDALDLQLEAPGLMTRRVSVTVNDNDSPTLQASATQVTVIEGNTIMVGVRLAYDPLGSVTVTAGIDSPAVATVTAGGSLMFDSSNYDDYQMVTIRAEQDNDLVFDDTFVTLQATSLGVSLSVPLRKTDDDQQVIETSATTVTLSETGMATFNVRLRFRPNGGATVNVGTGGSTHASAVPTSIPFTVGTFDMFQPVTVTGIHDVDLVTDPVTITLSGASAPVSPTVTATVTDVDQQIIQPSTSSLTVTEGGMGTFTVRLGFQPSAPVTVNLTSTNPQIATVDPPSIMFSNTTYLMPVLVTVRGTEDANAVPDGTSVVLRSTGLADQTIAITANDNDVQGLEVTAASITVGEGTTMMLGVRLRQDPIGSVGVTASSLTPAEVGVGGMTSFTFTSGNYTSYQYTTVDALQDNNLAVGTATIRFASVTPALSTDVSVTKPDDDTQAIDTTVNAVSLSENGTAQFGVRLRYEPPGDVTVQVASADGGKATTSGNLLFGPGTYATFVNVTVSGTDDTNLVAETVAINLTSPGNAPLKQVTATVNDDDAQLILGAPSSVNLTEGQQTTLNVRLAFQPSTPSVTVMVGAMPSGVITTSGNLNFTNSNWQSTQPLTITATQDTNLQPGSTTLSLSGASATTVTLPVNVTDDDTLAIVSSAPNLTVAENATGAFTVALSHQPNTDLTVSLGVNPTGIAGLSRSTIPFTTTNWNTPVSVTVTPVADPDNASESTTVTLSSGATSNATVGILVTDTTVVAQPGWPTSFLPTTSTFMGNTIWAYKIIAPGSGTWTLDTLSVIAGAAGNNTRLALYTDNADRPGNLLAGSAATAVAGGVNTIAMTPSSVTGGGVYWIAIMVSGPVAIGNGGLANQGRRCQKATLGFSDPWPTPSFGTSTCATNDSINVFATMHQ